MTVVVFDFDKTLTYSDTLFGFYREVAGHERYFGLKRVLYLCCAVLYKLKLRNNDYLKQVGVSLFLKGKSRQQLEESGQIYAAKIRLNQIYYEIYQSGDASEKIISTASFEEYVKFVFKEDRVSGSTLNYSEHDEVISLHLNNFGGAKVRSLRELGISKISKLYTDSFSDRPLMDWADEVFLVRDGKIV